MILLDPSCPAAWSAKMSSSLQNRFGRLLRLLSLFQAGPRYNALQLAQELRVSRRTVFRDIALLRDLGVPVDFDENADGYCVPASPVQAVANALDENQIETLLLAGHLSTLQLDPDSALSIREATANLHGRLPQRSRAELSNLLNACVVDLDSRLAPVDQEVLSTIFSAIRTRYQIRLTVAVERGQEPLRTKVAPYRLRFSPDRWRLVGRSSHHRSVCTFDVGSIESAELTEDSFEVPRGFYSRQADAQGITGGANWGKPQ